MKRLLLATFTLAFVTAACDNSTTSPVAAAPNSSKPLYGGTFGENPPPPPIDSGSVGLASGQNGAFTSVNLKVTYFLNKPENSGWLKFNRDDDPATDIDNSAAIKMTAGVFTGRGIIRITGSGGAFRIDLSKVSFGRTAFETCDPAGTDGGGKCFFVDLGGSGATFTNKDGVVSSATFIIGPDRSRGESCVPSSTDACIITVDG